jgi:hypothetical protein
LFLIATFAGGDFEGVILKLTDLACVTWTTGLLSFDALRNLEANAAASYFREWRDIPVTWPKADLVALRHFY